MANINLHKEYDSSGQSVQDLFDSTEEGFFVPRYQREYTWEEENINQLFDDLVLGTREFADNDQCGDVSRNNDLYDTERQDAGRKGR